MTRLKLRKLVGKMLLLIVPRHPQRFNEVARLVAGQGLESVRRSEKKSVPGSVSVFLGDSMGELAVSYAACDIAFVGGSLLPLGGQNLIEACAAAKPVLVGPHTWNFRDAAERAVAAGAAMRLLNQSGMADVLRAFTRPLLGICLGQQVLYVSTTTGACGSGKRFSHCWNCS